MSGADAEGALMMRYLVVLVLSILLYGRFSIASCELTCFGIRCTDESDSTRSRPNRYYVEADGRSKDQGKIFARKQFSFCKEVEV